MVPGCDGGRAHGQHRGSNATREDLVETLMPHLAPYATAVSRHVVAALA